jgi:hypothetical protein
MEKINVYNNYVYTVDKLKIHLDKKTINARKSIVTGTKVIHRHKWIKLYTINSTGVENLFNKLNITI